MSDDTRRIFRTQTAIAFVEEAHLVLNSNLTLAEVLTPECWAPDLLRPGTLVWAIVGDGRGLFYCVAVTHDRLPILEPFATPTPAAAPAGAPTWDADREPPARPAKPPKAA